MSTHAREAATEDFYACPFCGFTAGVRLPFGTGTDVVWIVRCISCGRTSPFFAKGTTETEGLHSSAERRR